MMCAQYENNPRGFQDIIREQKNMKFFFLKRFCVVLLTVVQDCQKSRRKTVSESETANLHQN